ncbi:MAG: AbrB/MazE/SpoVT family DNA-binding domain-containing protein [Candidatus Moraniibacteriota bacterium]|nr:MAG: AbrB/MazE/SpoVT family DNA-binding domain-containing protein [Candidatus Moranbacteria bacterium]
MQDSYTATFSSKGQLTFPSALRAKLGIKAGHKATISISQGKKKTITITHHKIPKLLDAFGYIKTNIPYVPIDQIRDQVYYEIGEYRANQMEAIDKKK